LGRPSFNFLVLALLALIWGSSFILMKRGLEHFDAPQLAALRMTIAMSVLLPIAFRNLRTIRGKFVPLFLMGLFGNAIPAFLFAVAQTRIPSSLSGMLNSLTSLFTLMVGVALFRMRVRGAQVAGVFVALIGTLGLIGFSHLAQLSVYGRYSLLVVAATCSYGIGINLIKAHLQEMRPHHITALAYLLTAPFLAVYLFFGTDFVARLGSRPEAWRGVFYVSLLGVMSTSVAVILFNKLVQTTTPVFASSVTYLIPVVAVGWGVADGETVDLSQFGYLILILGGIFMINLRRKPAGVQ
jgi:drug/metabolite transporter (DMT)-like permease